MADTYISSECERKVQQGIELLRTFEPVALSMHPDGYYLCYSGGKDSDFLLQLAIESGVKFTVHYNITTVDAAEVIKHIKATRTRIEQMGIKLIMGVPSRFTTGKYAGQVKTMWKLIEHKGMPPTRLARYCCAEFKERGGEGRLCLTGVRWQESRARAERRPMELVTAKKADKILFDDNDEDRMQFENCTKKGKKVINPMLAVTDNEVWEYLINRDVPYCILYDQGYSRIGCIGCPFAGIHQREEEFLKNPRIKQRYIDAMQAMIESLRQKNPDKEYSHKTGEDVFNWWLSW